MFFLTSCQKKDNTSIDKLNFNEEFKYKIQQLNNDLKDYHSVDILGKYIELNNDF